MFINKIAVSKPSFTTNVFHQYQDSQLAPRIAEPLSFPIVSGCKSAPSFVAANIFAQAT
jgi:hypothetical protein